MGLLDFFRTPKPYCIEAINKLGDTQYICNVFISKDELIVNKKSFVDMYGCIHGEAIATNLDSGRVDKYYYYYEFCADMKNAKHFPHISKMSNEEGNEAKIIFGSATDAGYKCKFVFHN